MGLISARTIITSLSLFHITLGFFFLTNPGRLADQTLVYALGEAMGMPHSRGFDAPSPSLAFLATILGTFGITDMITLSLPEEICLVHYWGMQAPVRSLISLALTFYSFLFSPSSPLYGGSGPRTRHPPSAAGYLQTSAGDGLKNRLFFTFMFIEMISWLWLWVTLREERDQIISRKASRRRSHIYAN